MDWSLFFDHYVQLFSDSLYWALMILWVMLPFAGAGIIIVAAYKGGQSMKHRAARKKIPRDSKNGWVIMTKKEMDTFDGIVKQLKREDH